MPAAPKAKRSRLPKRILLIAFISAFIIVPVFIIITRALPKQGVGSVFYWIHDHIFLPVKGYTYTLFYPFSLSWWGPILTVILVWLVAYLTMASFIKDPHVYVLRKVIRRIPKKRHRILIKTSGWLKKWKMEPILLKQVTNLERKKTLYQLENPPLTSMDETAISRVIHLTQLHIDLITMPPVKEQVIRPTYLQTLIYWHQAYLLAEIHCQKNSPSDRLKKSITRLAEQIEPLILPLLDYKDETTLKEAAEMRPGFDIHPVAVDLLYLASLNNSNLSVLLLGSPTTVAADAVKKAVISRLAASMNERRAILDESCKRLEKLLDQKTGPYNTGSSETFESLIKDKIDIKLNKDPTYPGTILPLICELSISVALHLSALADSVSIGLGYIDSLETYDFVFNCLELEETGEADSPYFTALQALNRLPSPGHYRLCAELAELELKEYENLWKQSVLKNDGTIRPGDFQLAKSRIQSLRHAAGPELDNHLK